MYMKNLGDRITIRLSPELRGFVMKVSRETGMSPSEVCRQCLYQVSRNVRKYEERTEEDGIDRTSNQYNFV